MQATLERDLRTGSSDGRPRNTTSDRMERIAERRRNSTEAALLAPPSDALWGDSADNATARARLVRTNECLDGTTHE